MSQRPHPFEGATSVDIVRQRLAGTGPGARAGRGDLAVALPTYARMASSRPRSPRKFARRVAKALNATGSIDSVSRSFHIPCTGRPAPR